MFALYNTILRIRDALTLGRTQVNHYKGERPSPSPPGQWRIFNPTVKLKLKHTI